MTSKQKKMSICLRTRLRKAEIRRLDHSDQFRCGMMQIYRSLQELSGNESLESELPKNGELPKF